MSLSLRDTAFALDDPAGSWSLKKSANIPISPSTLPDNEGVRGTPYSRATTLPITLPEE